jgi:hypothetical protein
LIVVTLAGTFGARENALMSEAKDKKEIDDTLREFGKCTLALCDMLHGDKPLGHIELLFIDNHIQVLQMAYLQWKRKNKPA